MALIGVRRALIRPKRAVAPAGPPVLTYVGDTGSGTPSPANVMTYSGIPIGPASGFAARRIILSIVANRNSAGFNGGLTSVTIGGIAATIHIATSTGGNDVAIASADVPTGTTANIVLTAGGTWFATPILGIYSVDDALMVSTTPSVASGNNSGTSVTTSASFTQTSGGFVVAGVALDNNAGGSGISISGYTNNAFGTSGDSGSLSSLEPVPSTVTATASASWAGGTSQGGTLAVAAWR